MNKYSDDFAELKRALALKKHERPEEGYFDSLSTSIREVLSKDPSHSKDPEFSEEALRDSVSDWFMNEGISTDPSPGALDRHGSQDSVWVRAAKAVFCSWDLKPALAGVYAIATIGLVVLGFLIGSDPESNPSMPSSNMSSSLPDPFRQWFGSGETITTKALKESSSEGESSWPRFWPESVPDVSSSLMDGFLTSASSNASSQEDLEHNLWNASPGFLADPTLDENAIGLLRSPAWAMPTEAILVSTNHNQLPPAFFEPIPLESYPVRYNETP